jgi:DNA replication protein DnaC
MTNKYANRANLIAERDTVSAELNFSLNGESPYSWQHCRVGEQTTAVCGDHGDYLQHSRLIEVPGRETRYKHSGCPDCLRDRLAGVEQGLRDAHTDELIERAGIARRFERCELDNYDSVNEGATANREACRRYADTWPERLASGTGMAMIGSCGTGKNHLAIGLTKKIIRDHQASVLITDVIRISRAMKSTWRANAERTEDEILDYFISPDLLIIDEVGSQTGSLSELSILQEVVNARYESVLPTILISNLNIEQLRAGVGDRIVDRVTDGGRNRLVFNWESYRGKVEGAAA